MEMCEKFGKQGLTFDDVLLIPAESDVTPNMIDLKTTLAGNVKLNTPIMTAAMDNIEKDTWLEEFFPKQMEVYHNAIEQTKEQLLKQINMI